MGDLLARHTRDSQRPAQESRAPPVPAKDVAPAPAQRPAYTSPHKALAYKNSRYVYHWLVDFFPLVVTRAEMLTGPYLAMS